MTQFVNVFSGRQFLDSNGDPYVGAKLFSYVAGTSTKATLTTDEAGASNHTNPIILNARGEPADAGGASQAMWQTAGVSIKLVLAPSTDTDPPVSAISTWDNLDGINDGSLISDQWTAGPTPTYISATSFSLVGDQTTNFHVGRRLKTTNTGGTIYSTITDTAYTSLTTITVVNDSGVLDSGLSAVSYGLISAANSSINAGFLNKDNIWTGQNVGLFSTGDVKLTIKTAADTGWILMDDGTIGNASSSATTRANADTASLFALVWDNITNAYCPIYDSAGAVSTRGASAAADYAANKRIRIPRTVGRAMAGSGSTGAYSSTFTSTVANPGVMTVDSNLSLYTGATVQVASTTTLPTGLSAATNYYVIRVSATTLSLATSLANAHAGTGINITGAGSGTHTMTMSLSTRTLGQHVGEEDHFPNQSIWASDGGGAASGSGATGINNNTPSTANIVSPTTFLNVMMKL